MRPHLNTAWHSFLGIITSHEARERACGSLCAAHVANWLVSCHLVFLQIGKLGFSAGALQLLSLLSWLLQTLCFPDNKKSCCVFCVFSLDADFIFAEFTEKGVLNVGAIKSNLLKEQLGYYLDICCTLLSSKINVND